MAEEQQAAPGADELEPKTPTDPNGAPDAGGAEDAGGGQGDDQPSPYDELAQKIGWVPKDQFQGDPSLWKPAEQFILDGREIQRNSAAELRALRSTVDNIARTSSSIVEQQVAAREAELVERYNAAVDDGNAKESFAIAEQIAALKQPVNGARPQPPTESIAFAERNKAWFQKDALATATAVEICNRLAAQGYDNATQLDAAEKEVKRLYPHLFGAGQNGKAPPGVNAPGNRAPAGNNGRAKGFADMPPEAQKVANDMVSRGVIKADTPEAAKAMFAKNYWQNAEGKA